MQKLIVFGRGRSGTTVLADELDRHPAISFENELIEYEGMHQYTIEPFMRTDRLASTRALDEATRDLRLLPYDWWTMREGLPADARAYDAYLDEYEATLAVPGVQWVGFKIIDNQLAERETLWPTLARRGYAALRICRRNVLRHALSGLIANQRGVYNRRNYEVPVEKYTIDPRELLVHMRRILVSHEKWKERLIRSGVRALQVEYEDFLQDKRTFFEPIFEFLGVENVELPDSDFTKMTPRDLSEIIANYGDLQITAQMLGMETSLAEA